jgi:cytoskeleton protein RodZ
MDIGTHLREARERRGVTLQQIAEATKLSRTTLLYIERNGFDQLPGGIFTKGYLRAYAAEVGADPEEVVREYVRQNPDPVDEAPAPPPARRLAAGRYYVPAGVAVGLMLVAYSAMHRSGREETPAAVSPVEVAAPVAPIEDLGAVAELLPAIRRSELPLSLEIQATRECWVSVVADGASVLYRLIPSGERVTVLARDMLVLRVGDPGALAYTLNGAVGRPLGKPGKPVTVEITRTNFQTFLADPAADTARLRPASVT